MNWSTFRSMHGLPQRTFNERVAEKESRQRDAEREQNLERQQGRARMVLWRDNDSGDD